MDRLKVPLLCVLCIVIGLVLGFLAGVWGLCWFIEYSTGGLYF